MKFLHEMIAKKRLAQAEMTETEEAEAPAFDLPKMSAVSQDATPIAQVGDDGSAAILPYRQRQNADDADAASEPRGFAPQQADYDWDVSDIDLSEEREAAALNADVVDAASDAFGEGPADDESTEASHAIDMDEPEIEFDAQRQAAAFSDHADEEPEDEPKSPASLMAEDPETESAFCDDASHGSKPQAESGSQNETIAPAAKADVAEAAESEMSEENDMSIAGHSAEEPETRHRSAAEAAASLARQIQQRKIWDLEPPEASEPVVSGEDEVPRPDAPAGLAAADEPEPAADREPEAEPGPVADVAPMVESEPVAEIATEPETETVPLQAANSEPEPNREMAAEPAAQAEPAPDASSDIDSEIAAVPTSSRPRGGRVKTRLLGFHKPEDENVDPISAAATSSASEVRFPVGWVVVLKGPGRGASFTLTAGASKIGRGEDQAIRLDFGDTSISRDNHAVVAYDDEKRRFIIGHGGKANLVRLNDMPILSTEPLSNGDTIRIGETTLMFVALCSPEFSWADEGQEPAHAASH